MYRALVLSQTACPWRTDCTLAQVHTSRRPQGTVQSCLPNLRGKLLTPICVWTVHVVRKLGDLQALDQAGRPTCLAGPEPPVTSDFIRSMSPIHVLRVVSDNELEAPYR